MMTTANPPVPFNLLMAVKLEARQWNDVLAALGKAPYEIIKPVVEAIDEQLRLQAQAHAAAPTNGAGEMRENGLDHPPPAELPGPTA